MIQQKEISCLAPFLKKNKTVLQWHKVKLCINEQPSSSTFINHLKIIHLGVYVMGAFGILKDGVFK